MKRFNISPLECGAHWHARFLSDKTNAIETLDDEIEIKEIALEVGKQASLIVLFGFKIGVDISYHPYVGMN